MAQPHRHVHSHSHSHAHDRGPRAQAGTGISLLRFSAGARLCIASALSALIWVLVFLVAR